MDLDEEELSLLNNVSENGIFLEDSSEEAKNQVSGIIQDALAFPVDELDPDLIRKLYYGECQIYRLNHFQFCHTFVTILNFPQRNISNQRLHSV